MKTILRILFALCLLTMPVRAVDYITALVTVTNDLGTTNGQTITIFGSTRTFTNSVVTTSEQILTNATIGGTATNIFNHFGTHGVAGMLLTRVSTNAIRFGGFDLTASVSAGWGTVVLATNLSTNAWAITVPMSTITDTNRTNIASLFATDFGSYSTNALSQYTILTTNLMGLVNTQWVAGVKRFTNSGSLFANSTASNMSIVGASAIGGTVTILTNGTWKAGTATNLTAYIIGGTIDGALITNSLLSGSLTGTNNFNLRVWDDPAQLYHVWDFDVIDSAGTTNTPIRFRNFNLNHFYYDINTAPDANVSIKSGALLTNLNFTGTNHFTGDVSFARKDNSSLANGNNAAVDPHTNAYIKVSGPTAAFVINGIQRGRDGREIEIQNSTGYTLTVANDSGVDPVAANRIYTGTSGDITVTNNPGFVRMKYDSSTSRWGLTGYGGTAVAGVSSVAMSVPSQFAVSGSPITGSGTLAVTLTNSTGSGAVVLSSNASFGGNITFNSGVAMPFSVITNASYQMTTNDFALVFDPATVAGTLLGILPTNAPENFSIEMSIYDPAVSYTVRITNALGGIRSRGASDSYRDFTIAGNEGARFYKKGTNWYTTIMHPAP